MTYQWEQDAKDCYDLAIACKRAEWLKENVPGVKDATDAKPHQERLFDE